MKIVQINSVCGSGSTGKICVFIGEILSKAGIENYILYTLGKSESPTAIKYSNEKYIKIQSLKSRILGNYGFNSSSATNKLIAYIEEINPDIVQLHNIHSHDCNLTKLFQYFQKKGIKLFWTFHDCWAFTGYCPHFDMIGCELWKTGCSNCPQRKSYSWFFDRSSLLQNQKKELFRNLDMTIVTPSFWLADKVKKSFLSQYEIKVIHNGINLNVFHPTKSTFRKKYNCENKIILLGVAFLWDEKKGLDVFIDLAKKLDKEYQIVLVGTDDKVDLKLPDNIISIHQTKNQIEMAEIYTTADLLVNPTREDNYPTVNMEALACGTPVVTYKTGGSPEMLNEQCGSIIEKNDVDKLKEEIIHITKEKKYSKAACVEKAKEFDMNICYYKYLKLYEEWANDRTSKSRI